MTSSELAHFYQDSADAKKAIAKIENAMNKPQRTLIGLTGGPGSGKSTFAEYITSYFTELHGNQVICLSMDGFHLFKKQLSELPNSEEALAKRGAPWTFNSLAFANRIEKIQQSYQQQDVLWPSFDHGIGDPVEDDICIPRETKVVLIEGLYLLHQQDDWQQASSLFDEHWFLDIPLEVAIERLAQRHMKSWGLSHIQAMEKIYKNDNLNAKLVLSTKNHADWLLNG